MNYKSKKNSSSKRGVVLLISVLVASVALAVGLGVYQRTYKELYFSSFWKQTQIASVAADSGLECATYWDLHPSATPQCFTVTVPGLVAGGSSATYTYTGGMEFVSTPTPQCPCDTGGAYECNGGALGSFTGTDIGLICYDWWGSGFPSLIYDRTAVGGASGVSPGSFDLDTYNGCVKITITKPAPSGLSTRIEARGYNNTCATIATNPRTVERGLYVEY